MNAVEEARTDGAAFHLLRAMKFDFMIRRLEIRSKYVGDFEFDLLGVRVATREIECFEFKVDHGVKSRRRTRRSLKRQLRNRVEPHLFDRVWGGWDLHERFSDSQLLDAVGTLYVDLGGGDFMSSIVVLEHAPHLYTELGGAWHALRKPLWGLMGVWESHFKKRPAVFLKCFGCRSPYRQYFYGVEIPFIDRYPTNVEETAEHSFFCPLHGDRPKGYVTRADTLDLYRGEEWQGAVGFHRFGVLL